MLSVLIPVFNQDVTALTETLYRQAKDLAIPFEIRLYDDGSYFQFKIENQKLAVYPNVVYSEMKKNLGRAAIRNKLAKDAKFDTLLFLDCDSGIPNGNFLKNYMDCKDEADIINGGREYTIHPPKEEKFLLHWTYGTQRESQPVEVRTLKPYRSFMTPNFVIQKKVFERVWFNESLKKYGHEDTLFGYHLKKQKFTIKHIDNPVLHLGLEDTETFLEKAATAVKNFKLIQKKTPLLPGGRMLAITSRIDKFGLSHLVLATLKTRETKILENLRSNEPNLRQLDLYKLMVYYSSR